MKNQKKTLPKDWKVVKLGDIAQIVNGATPTTYKDEFWGGDIVWVTPKDLGKLQGKEIYSSERFITREGFNSCNLSLIPMDSIVLSTRAPIGYIAINKVSLCYNQGCKGIIANEDIDNKYLFYFLFQSKDKLKNLGSGSTFKELSSKKLKSFDIILPSLNEQKRIVQIIELKLMAIEILKLLTEQNLYYVSRLLTLYIQEVFGNNKKYIFKFDKLSNYCIEDRLIVDGGQSDLPYLGLEMVQASTGIVNWNVSRLDGKGTCFYFDSRHVLYSKLRPYLNKVVLPENKGKCTTELIPLFPNENISRDYLALLLRRNETVNYVMAEKTGSRMPRANMHHLLNMVIPIPSLEIQKQIVNTIKNKEKLIENIMGLLNQQLFDLNNLSKSIVRQAFRGES